MGVSLYWAENIFAFKTVQVIDLSRVEYLLKEHVIWTNFFLSCTYPFSSFFVSLLPTFFYHYCLASTFSVPNVVLILECCRCKKISFFGAYLYSGDLKKHKGGIQILYQNVIFGAKMYIQSFAHVFCTSLNGNAYGTKYPTWLVIHLDNRLCMFTL